MTTTSSQNNNASQLDNISRESNESIFVGIDIAKDELVVHILPSHQQRTVPNSLKGIQELIKLYTSTVSTRLDTI